MAFSGVGACGPACYSVVDYRDFERAFEPFAPAWMVTSSWDWSWEWGYEVVPFVPLLPP
jgi:hypothetical protein